MKNNWSQFHLRVNIAVPSEKVYAAWATRAGLESWFLRQARAKADPLQKGDEYAWRWHGYPDEIEHTGTIAGANGKDQFSFTFTMGALVNVSIFRECEETIVELTESDLPVDEDALLKRYVEDYKGWIFYLVNLKSVLEGGLDLRNRKGRRGWRSSIRVRGPAV
ncbi:MAG TPA: SRPBCC domain-containing protein [Puia sp.]